MSRIGKLPIVIPAGVTVTISGNEVKVKGPKGELVQTVSPEIKVEMVDGEIHVTRPNDEKQTRALHGLYRALIHNMVVGVSEGYKKELELVGVGYRAQSQGQVLELSLGYSHAIFLRLPAEIKVEAKSERNKNIIMTLISKISENANIENVVEWFNDEDTVNYLSGILLTDFEIIDENKAIEDIEKIYLKERKVKRRNQIIKLLEDKTNLTNDEAAKLEKELNSIIIDLARMK